MDEEEWEESLGSITNGKRDGGKSVSEVCYSIPIMPQRQLKIPFTQGLRSRHLGIKGPGIG